MLLRRWLLAATVLCCLSDAAVADGIAVSPVRVVVPNGQRSTAITLSNHSDKPQRVQVEAFRWSRVDGQDVLEEDPQLLLNPPLFEVAPGGSQIVRLGLRKDAVVSGERETAYRVFFQEVPRAEEVSSSQLQMVLRIGVPVFLAPAKVSKPLDWQAQATADGLQLALTNHGNTHVRIAELSVAQSPSAASKVPGFAYVFPGETRRWTVADAPLQGPLQISAITDSGRLHAELPVAAATP